MRSTKEKEAMAVKDREEVLAAVIAVLVGTSSEVIPRGAYFSDIFAENPEGLPLLWEVISELAERKIPVSKEWTITSLAMEWAKTRECKPHDEETETDYGQ